MNPTRIETGAPALWQMQATEVPADAASRLRQRWAAQANHMAFSPVHGMEWRAQVVFRLLAQPEHWGALGAILGPRLLAECGRFGVSGVLEILDASGAQRERLDIAAPRDGAVIALDSPIRICRDGARFGVWREGGVEWPGEGKSYGGLCHALMAAVSRGSVDDVSDESVRPMIESIPALVCDAPNAAAMLWHELMDNVTCTGTDGAERPKFAAALALALPMMGPSEIETLMTKLEGADARIDFFHLTGAIRRRLDARRSGQTVADVITRFRIRDLERAARENARREPDLACGKAVLETLLELASQCGVLDPWRGTQEAARQSRRIEAWDDTLYEWDRQTWRRAVATPPAPAPAPSAPARLGHAIPSKAPTDQVPFAVPGTAHAKPWPLSVIKPVRHAARNDLTPATAGGVFALPAPADHAAEAAIDAGAPLLGAGTLIASWTLGRALRVGMNARTVQTGGVAFGVMGVLAVARYAYDCAKAWVGHEASHVSAPDHAPTALPESARPPRQTLREALDLSQLLTLDAWMTWDHAAETYARGVSAYTESLIREVLEQRGTVPSNLTALLEQRATVTYRSVPFLVMGNAHGVPFMTYPEREQISLRDIALGSHYQKESLKLGAIKEVRSVTASDGNPDVIRFLSEVDNDAFRQALYDEDIAHLSQLEQATDAISAFGHYVNSRAFTTILEARSSNNTPKWATDIVKQAAAEGERGNSLRLLTFHKKVMPGLLAARHNSGESALLLSLKSGTWFWWDRTVERGLPFREFMASHLSARDLAKLDSPIHISDIQFRIGRDFSPSSMHGWGPRAGGPVGLWFADSATRREMYVPDFEFHSSQSIRDELWQAEVRTVRENMDMRVVTKSWRERRDRTAIQHAMLQGSGVFFPLLFGAFPLSFWVSPAAFGAGVTTSFANLMLISTGAADVDLEGLRKAQHDMKLGTLMMFVHLLPVGAPEWRIFRAAFGYTLAASGSLLRRSHAIVDVVPPHFIAERRAMVQSLVGIADMHVPDNATPSEDPPRPWDVIAHVRAAYTERRDTGERRTGGISNRNVARFLGLRRAPVTTRDELLRLPEGYALALADELGTMFFAGMTCGGGRVVGSSTDPAIVALPTDFSVVDFGSTHAGVLTFHQNDSVEIAGNMLSMFIDETIRERVPAVPIFGADLRRPMAPPAPVDTNATSPAPVTILQPPANVTVPEAYVPWRDIVDQWRGNRSSVPLRTTDRIAPYKVLEFRNVIFRRWNKAGFKEALSDVLARVETGVLLWHLPFLDTQSRALALRRLQGDEPLRTARLHDATLYGVVALSGEEKLSDAEVLDGTRNYLLVSLITGDVLGWKGNLTIKGQQALQAFIRPHLSEHGLWMYKNSLNEDGELPGVPTDASPDPLAAVAFMNRLGGHDDMVSDLHNRIFWDLHCRASDVDACKQDHRAHDMLFLVGYAASVLSMDDAQKLTRAVRALLRPRASDNPFASPREDTSAESAHTRWTGPDLSLAHSIGLTAREAAAANGKYPLADETPDDAMLHAINLIDAQLTPYTTGIARGEMAGLVEWGLNSSTFGRALLNASFYLEGADRFSAVIDTIGDAMPIRVDGYTSGSFRRGLVKKRR